MEKPKFQKEELCYACTFVGSFSDLTLIDFSFLNLQFIDLNNEEDVKSYFEKASVDDWAEHNYNSITKIKEDFTISGQMFLLAPIQLKVISEAIFYDCLKVLTVIFPSDIQINNIIHFQLFDEKCLYYVGHTGNIFHFSGLTFEDEDDYFLFFLEETKYDINKFIRFYFDRKDSINYLQPIVFNYISSFREPFPHLGYISLCICLESIVQGTEDISYRIRRNLAVLCGDNASRSEIIFQNVKKIYDLRSRIVHGDKYQYHLLSSYLIYLRALISRMIIELVLHNIISLKELNEKLTSTGFGANNTLSEDYAPLDLNIVTYVKIISNDLPKVK